MIRILRLLLYSELLLLATGCSRKGAIGSYVQRSIDPDGIPVVENGPIPQQWDGTLPLLRLEELAVVGEASGLDEQMISGAYSYMQVALGPGGQIGYIERQPAELRVYDDMGKFLWRAGRSGEGPGEWRNASYLTYMQDVGWVIMTYPHRLVIFGDEGTLLESRPTRDMPGIRHNLKKELHLSGVLWSWTQDDMMLEESFGHLFRGNWKTLEAAEVDSMLHSTLTYEGASAAYITSIPMSMAADSRGRLWLNHSLYYQIEVYEAESNDRWRVRREFERIPYTNVERRQRESQIIAGTGDRYIYGRSTEYRPPIRELKWVTEDELWVFTSTYVDSPLVQVDVFDAEGVYQQAFRADESLRWGQFQNGALWQLKENDEGIPQLIRSRYWIERQE